MEIYLIDMDEMSIVVGNYGMFLLAAQVIGEPFC